MTFSSSTAATSTDLSTGGNELEHFIEIARMVDQVPTIDITPEAINEKSDLIVEGVDPEVILSKPAHGIGVLETVEDLVTTIIHVDDDPTLNPWTFRMFFIDLTGLGLSAFGAVLQEIFYFKPQVIFVSSMFLTVVSYALGEFLAHTIPRWGRIGLFLNPGPFNAKEHAATILMASAASASALSTEALAVQKLFYGGYPSQVAGVLVTLSSQLIGYGISGMLRRTLLWPVKMFYPGNLPITTVLETLHREKNENKKRMRVFWILFACLVVWELVPEYMFPLLIGVSIFCLAKQDSLVFTNLFGGAQGNEGVGFLSICFDWNYIGSPLFLPLQTLVNSFIGSIGCIVLLMGLYYGNVWRSQDFPFLSQFLFDGSSNSTNFITYNLTSIFTSEFIVDNAAVDAQGIPWMTSSYVGYLITSNAALTATIIHMLLWNYNEVKIGWAFANKKNMKRLLTPSTYFFWKYSGTRSEEEKEAIKKDPTIDPHYKVMVDYSEVPNSWYFFCFILSFITAIISLYFMRSTLPWWGLIIGTLMLSIFTLFFGAQYAITGFGFNLQPIFQMLAGYMFPGRPLANMYFTTFTFGGYEQGLFLLRDLKLAQQNKLSPRCAFTTQVIGCLFGACLNYATMIIIVQNQADVLLSIEGTSIWSGASIQQFNTLAIAWSIAPKMFSIGARYEWVTAAYLVGFLAPLPFYFMHWYSPNQGIWSYINSAIILWFMGDLSNGINSSIWSYYVIGFIAQFFVRRYRPQYFVKWNYLMSAALDGGTQVCVFLLTFAVQGGSGVARPFPTWWGNRLDNVDLCMYNPASYG